MKQFREYQNVFFIGIGGIGMSALARFFNTSGYNVAGYDRTRGPVTDALCDEGIEVVFDEEVKSIPDKYTDPAYTLVVYTPAVPSKHDQLIWFSGKGFTVLKRSKVLGMITEDTKSVCVAGTHGKTTVSTMVAFLFHNSKLGVNAFLGGISKNFGTNFLINIESDLVVLEADEFDRSFLQLTPYTALITSMDADHLDIYGTAEEVKEGFLQFAARIRKNGILLIKSGLQVPDKLAEGVRVFSYSMEQEADYSVHNLREKDGIFSFDLKTPDGILKDFTLGIPGLINVENAVAALALGLMNGVEPDEMKESLLRFKGISRRFDVIINTPRLVYIDDYAHHPEEIRATLKGVRKAYHDRKITGVFQPHLFSRTRDFAREFAAVLDEGLDRIILLPVYPAREEPIQGVSSEIIAAYLDPEKYIIAGKEDLLQQINKIQPDVLITMGAGDIDRLVPEIHKWGLKNIL